MKKLTSLFLVLVLCLTFAPLSVFAADAKIITSPAPAAAQETAAPAKGTPTASVSEGSYDRTQKVTLTTEIEGAVIYYTTDGSEPTVNSIKYTGEIRISRTTILKAIAVKDGVVAGDVMSAVYTLSGGYMKLLLGLVASMMGIEKPQETVKKIEKAELLANGAVVTSANVGDVITLVTIPRNAVGNITWTVGGTEIDNNTKTYTVTTLDMGKTISAQIVGTDLFEGTASAECTVAKTTTVVAEDIMNTEVDSSPVVLTKVDSTKFLNDNGEEVDVDDSATLTLTIENPEKSEEEVSENTTLVVQSIIENTEVDAENLSDVTAVAVDVDLEVNDTPVHPVGEVVVTLSAAQLGLAEGTDLSAYVFKANHTNKEDVSETVDGTVVTIDGVQYVRFTLNGLSTIWIGNVPPRTVSFYNTEADADNKVNSIGSVIVKFGDLTPTLQIPTPSRAGYLFCGWNYDMTRTPIITNLEVHALWVKGENVPADSITAELNQDTTTVNVEISDGLVKIDPKSDEPAPAGLTAKITVAVPEGAVKYYAGTDASEVAAFDEADGFAEINPDEAIGFDVDVTDKDGLMIAFSTTYYYKWIDEAGETICLQGVEAKVANGTETATSKTYTVDVNRGIGKFEAYLIDSDDRTKDYVAYINNNLYGSIDGYTLSNNVSFDGYKADYNFSAYDTLKFVFTPFEGQTYTEADTIKALGEYYDGSKWNENWTGTCTIEDGNLVITYPFNVETMPNDNAGVYIILNEVEQNINIHWDHIRSTSGSVEIKYENIRCETWAEVLEALKTIDPAKRYSIYCTDSAAILLESSLTIPANVDITLSKTPSFTVGKGATFTLTDDSALSCAASLRVTEGDFIAADGGAVKTARVPNELGVRYSISLDAYNVLFKSGSSLTVPKDTYLYIDSTHSYNDVEDGICTFEAGSVVNSEGRLHIGDFDTVNLNGTFNVSNYMYFYNDEINIAGDVNFTTNGWGYLELYGTVNVESTGSIVVNNTSTVNRYYTNLEIYGPLTNRGTIEIKGKSEAVIMNNGFVNYNIGTISIADGCCIMTTGTKFINTGKITGAGTIYATLGDDYTNYDDGTEYVDSENNGHWDDQLDKFVYNLADYSRYKYTHDPDATVDVIVYLAEVVNMGDGQCTVTVEQEKFPEK